MKKKSVYIFVLILVLIAILVSLIVVSVNKSNEYNLSLSEKNWIEKNKTKIFSLDIQNGLIYFSKDGSGLFFDYIDYVQSKTKLQVEPIIYNDTKMSNTYFHIMKKGIDEKIGKKDYILYEDNYVIVGKSKDRLTNPNLLANKKIGVISSDISKVSYFLNINSISYSTYSNSGEISMNIKDGKIDYGIMSRNDYYENFISDSGYGIVYEVNEYKNLYVLTIDTGYSRLDSILKKLLLKFKKEELQTKYNDLLFEDYYLKNNISDKEKTDFLSKEYVYGYVDNRPYEFSKNAVITGYNKTFINKFENLTKISIKYKKYSSIANLSRALSKNEVDFAFNYYNFSNIKNDKYIYTNSIYESKYLILRKENNTNIFVNSLNSLKNIEVNMLNTKLYGFVKEKSDIEINKYSKVSNLRKTFDNKSIVIIDYNIYNIYKNSIFKHYVCLYEDTDTSSKGFILLNNNRNNLFNNALIYYINSFNHDKHYNDSYKEYLDDTNNTNEILIVLGILVIGGLVGAYFIKKMIKPHVVNKKEEVLRYVDDLTLVKNRNYLNKNFKKWENNIIYPQAIIMVNLNNIRHINDVYGHDEGDKVIKLAANILINNQLEQSDIVRTDGNEFLIYIIGYSEAKVIAYMRKLYTELKELPYGFGASLGYSMIEDDVKTIDDAINEAVLEIRTNKKLQTEDK